MGPLGVVLQQYIVAPKQYNRSLQQKGGKGEGGRGSAGRYLTNTASSDIDYCPVKIRMVSTQPSAWRLI